MLASIIITNYNYGRYIGRCLRSCLNQTLSKKDYEIIIRENKKAYCHHLDGLQRSHKNIFLIYNEKVFGFGKNHEQNFKILYHLKQFQTLGCPILMGVSRKSMIYKHLNISPSEALNGTTALHAWGLERGANILRVHDVKQAKECIDLWGALQ